MKILITGAGALLGQGIIKSLRLSRSSYQIIAADPDPRAVGLYWADRAYLLPLVTDPSYLEKIEFILQQERPDALLIGTDVELMKLSLHRTDLEARYNTRVIVSSPEVVRTADDKWLTFEFLRANGFPHPRSVLPGAVPELIAECGFPLVVKPRHGARSVGTTLVYDEKELTLALGLVVDPVIQECVGTPNEEYTSGLLVTNDTVHAVVTMRRDLRDGNTYRAYVQPESIFNPFLQKVASTLHPWGPVNLQFRIDKGVPKIFEINARFSGTTPIRAYAGFNEVDALVRHIVRGEPIPEPSVQGIVVLRYFEEMVVDPTVMNSVTSGGPCEALGFDQPFNPLRVSNRHT